MAPVRDDNLTYIEQRRLEELAKAARSACMVKDMNREFAELRVRRLQPTIRKR
jgi:hypothetical protein